MSDSVKGLFAFVSLVAILIVVVSALNKPQGVAALSSGIFGGFTSVLGTLSNVAR